MDPANTLFDSLGLGLGVAVVGSIAAGLHRRANLSAERGLEALNQLKWREFAECASALFVRRGFALSNHDRKPGDGGVDLKLERDGKVFVAQLKESASYRVDAPDLDRLAQVMRTQGARGGFIVTTGSVDRDTLTNGRTLRIEIIHGAALWREIADHVPRAITEGALASARESWVRRLVAVGAAAVATSLLAFAGLYLYPRLRAGPARVAAPVAGAATAADEEIGSLAPPPSAYSTEELAARRQQASDQVGAVEGVASVGWSTKSTLVIGVNGGGKAGREKIIAEVCTHLMTFEELRLTRLQVHEFEPTSEEDARVHWQQCR